MQAGECVNMRPVSIYVHVPFCISKCTYCDFASYPNRLKDAEQYFETLLREIAAQKDALRDCEVQTVFFGGGTPTIVDADCIVRTLETLSTYADISRCAEITIEGNPGTLRKDKLNAYRRAGVNRLSLGVQSMRDTVLRFLGRIHTVQDVREAVWMARECGFENLNLDLIYNLPNQSVRDWQETLHAAMQLQPEHISAYSLIVEEDTVLYGRVSSGECSVPGEEICIEMQRTATRMLSQEGYARYEISNYAKAGFECRHNLNYWRRGEYIGFGCAAHSLFQNKRFANPRDLNAYLSGQWNVQKEALNRQDALEETLMLGLRMCEGISLVDWHSQFGFRLEKRGVVQKLISAGLACVDSERLWLTEKGMEVQDAVVLALLE